MIDLNGNIKIADFGMSFQIEEENKIDKQWPVVSLWYRPPEIFVGSKDYSYPIDLWSIGAIYAGLKVQQPIFHCPQFESLILQDLLFSLLHLLLHICHT